MISVEVELVKEISTEYMKPGEITDILEKLVDDLDESGVRADISARTVRAQQRPYKPEVCVLRIVATSSSGADNYAGCSRASRQVIEDSLNRALSLAPKLELGSAADASLVLGDYRVKSWKTTGRHA